MLRPAPTHRLLAAAAILAGVLCVPAVALANDADGVRSYLLYPHGLACERIPEPPGRGLDVLVDPHQPMMQPLDRSGARGIERRMCDLAVLVDTQVRHR